MGIKGIKRVLFNYKEKRKARKRIKNRPLDGFQLPFTINNFGNKIAIVGIFKNESTYIDEWIKFHRMVGFNRFILYDNGSDEKTAEIAKANSLEGDITVIDWKTFNVRYGAQLLAYSHAAANYGGQCEWMCCIDIDEFLFPIEHRPIGDILQRYKDIPSISIPWHMYGHSGHRTPPDGSVIANFQQRVSFPPTGDDIKWIYKYKSIFQPQYLLSCCVHLPFMSIETEFFYNERKEKIHRSKRFDVRFAFSDVFRLNHYYTRDKASLDAKMNKGRVSAPTSERRKVRKWRRLIKRASIIGEGEVCDPIALQKWRHSNDLEFG